MVREVARQQRRITVRDARRRVIETLELTRAPDVADQVARINAAFAKAQGAYRTYDDLLPRRRKVTVLLLLVLLTQELFFSFIRRRYNDYHRSLRVFNLVGWMGVGCWLVFSFLKG